MTAIFLFLLGLALDGGKITPVVVVILTLSLFIIGYATLDLQERTLIWPYYALNSFLLLLGYHGFNRLKKSNICWGDTVLLNRFQGKGGVRLLSNAGLRQMHRLCVIISLLVAYHYVVGGIPILSPDVEVERFQFSSSGLFGIPGRMAIFGLPFIVLYVSIYYWRTQDLRVKRLFRCVWVIFIFFSLLSGFKSSVLRAIDIIILARLLVGNALRISEFFSRRIKFLSLLAVFYIVWLSFRYASLGLTDVTSFLDYIVMRLFTIPARPGHYAITNLAGNANSYSYFLGDIFYFVHKYFGISLGGGDIFPLDLTVSSALHGVPLTEGSWIVPVTVGSFAGWYVDIGFLGAVTASIVTGTILAIIISRSISARGAFSTAILGLTVDRVTVYIVSGGFGYTVVNLSAVIVFLYILRFFTAMTLKNVADTYAKKTLRNIHVPLKTVRKSIG